MIVSGGYGRLERLLYRMAFAGIELQKSLADIEDRVLAPAPPDVISRPVFVTSLPRAGTTLLLNTLAGPGMASHTYRDMPFVLCPLLWNRISGPFARTAQMRERAHGDGMSVGFDSPEGFEEMVWKSFWPAKYCPEGIQPWTAADRDPEFEDFLRRHIAKIMMLRGGSRYIAKNNANIARIPLLRALFPDGTILVPVRNPLDHAGALLRQHLRFLDIQAMDGFARKYMEAAGHLEFGALHRPLLFNGVKPSDRDPETLDYWLEYWIAAAEHLLVLQDEGLHFINYDAWCEAPQAMAHALATVLALPSVRLTAMASDVHTPTRYGTPSDIDGALLDRAKALHAALVPRTITP